MSSAINAVTARCFPKLNAVSLIPTGPVFKEALAIAKANPQLAFGVHLDLTEFPPLTHSPLLQKLHQTAARNQKPPFPTPALAQAILSEWQAQVEAVAEQLPIAHLDTHQHLHWLPGYFELFKTLQLSIQAPRLRGVSGLGASGLRSFWRKSRAFAKNTLLRSPPAPALVLKETGSLAALQRAGLEDAAEIELILHLGHPGFPLDELWLGSHIPA
jgi:predicted glycoside hydrolase/deacetylase ChbG (UPF0249 family)